MNIYVNVNAAPGGDGSEEKPFRKINDAARLAEPGDTVLVAPGVYRENVDPVNAGTCDKRITYVSTEPLGAVITGAERITSWESYSCGCDQGHTDDNDSELSGSSDQTQSGGFDPEGSGNVWVCRISNDVFDGYNPYTILVYGDWYFARADKHTGCVYLNGQALYETATLEECIRGEVYECSWEPERSTLKWYARQDEEADETVIYANFQGADPNRETVEINVRRECFFPSKTGVGYITVRGFRIEKAATTWAPPAAFQDGMIGPNWSKGWIIEDCEICDSKCAGISVGRYYDPDNDNYFTTKYVKSPTQMERDSVCRGQYHGWLKENIGNHIIRRNDIHNCQQGGIIGRMGGVFSIIENNHIHHINNMMELGGAEIAGIKMHAAIDVLMQRNHIHHCTMGIWCDWEAQGTRITHNYLHDNMRPAGVKQLKGGMMSQDIFVEVSHGPTIIDNNLLMSDVSLRFATQGVALVHNLICGAFTCVGEGTSWRYTPYHIPHRTEVMGFMTILHGDNRIYNNVFVQKWPSDGFEILHDTDDGKDIENRQVGTFVFDDYPTEAEWSAQFDKSAPADLAKLEHAHFGHLPMWCEGNLFLNGAKPSRHDKDAVMCDDLPQQDAEAAKPSRHDRDAVVKNDLPQQEISGDVIRDIYPDNASLRLITSDILGKAFEPEQRFEAADGQTIVFDTDYNGEKRSGKIQPGPFADLKALDEYI